MPVYKNRTTLKVSRLKAFLRLEAGLTRGEVPDRERDLERELEQARCALREKDRRIARLEKGLAGDGSPDPLREEFERRGPWISRFVLDGKEYGGRSDAMNDVRLDLFFRSFPDARRILELGSLEGGHTLGLATRPGVESVLGIEARRESVERAEFVKGLYGAENVGFVVANLEETDLSEFGRFDAVFCSGLLYHLPEPWKLVENVSRVTDSLFVWTHYAREEDADTVAHGLKGLTWQEGGVEEPLSGMSPTSFWPTLDGLKAMLAEHGFTGVEILTDNRNHPHGPAVTLAAKARR